jgi:hypothetical protein
MLLVSVDGGSGYGGSYGAITPPAPPVQVPGPYVAPSPVMATPILVYAPGAGPAEPPASTVVPASTAGQDGGGCCGCGGGGYQPPQIVATRTGVAAVGVAEAPPAGLAVIPWWIWVVIAVLLIMALGRR